MKSYALAVVLPCAGGCSGRSSGVVEPAKVLGLFAASEFTNETWTCERAQVAADLKACGFLCRGEVPERFVRLLLARAMSVGWVELNRIPAPWSVPQYFPHVEWWDAPLDFDESDSVIEKAGGRFQLKYWRGRRYLSGVSGVCL